MKKSIIAFVATMLLAGTVAFAGGRDNVNCTAETTNCCSKAKTCECGPIESCKDCECTSNASADCSLGEATKDCTTTEGDNKASCCPVAAECICE